MGRWAIVCVLVAWGCASVAEAQTTDAAATVARGRELYAQGLAAFEGHRYDDALTAFHASYDASRVPAALYNVVTTLRAMDRYAEALETARVLLRDHPELDARLSESLVTIVRELRTTVALVSLLDVPLELDPILELDGSRRAAGTERPIAIAVDPGAHTLRLTLPDRPAFEWRGELAMGERREVHVQFEQPSVDPMPWILGGIAAAVVIGVAIALGVYFASPSYPPHDHLTEI